MATTRTIELDGLLEVEIEVELGGIHFTDEYFEFALVVRNRSDERLTGTLALVTELETTLGLDRDPIRKELLEIDLPPDETHREPFSGVGMIGGSGTGILLGIHRPEVVDSGDGVTRIEPGDHFLPLASAVFWDRDHYRINYRWPRRAQYVSVLFALLSAVLAGAIVWLSLS